MKKIIALIMAALMIVSLCACGGDTADKTDSNNPSGSNSGVSEDKDKDKGSSKDTLSLNDVMKAKETKVSLFEYTEVDGGIAITGYTGSDEIVVLPEKIDSQNVVSINEFAFTNNETVKGVRISAKVEVIGMYAFSNCTELEVFVSGDSVKVLDKYSFNNCPKLHTVKLNDGLETLNDFCFGLTTLTELEIPSSVTEITMAFTRIDTSQYTTIIAESGSAAEQYVKEYGSVSNLIFQAK